VDHQIDETELVPKKVTKRRFRKSILHAWNGRCAYCNEVLGRNSTLDHVLPRSKGGETVLTNLVACCFSCNSRKSSHPVFEWYQSQLDYCPLREHRLHCWLSGETHESHPLLHEHESATSRWLATADGAQSEPPDLQPANPPDRSPPQSSSPHPDPLQ